MAILLNSGQKIGHLTLLCVTRKDSRHRAYWKCLCECGNTTEVRHDNLKASMTVSCGCLRKTSGRSTKRLRSVTGPAYQLELFYGKPQHYQNSAGERVKMFMAFAVIYESGTDGFGDMYLTKCMHYRSRRGPTDAFLQRILERMEAARLVLPRGTRSIARWAEDSRVSVLRTYQGSEMFLANEEIDAYQRAKMFSDRDPFI